MKNICPYFDCPTPKRLACLITAFVATLSGLSVQPSASVAQQNYLVTFRADEASETALTSSFSIRTELESFTWTTVEKNGDTTRSLIRLDSIRELILTAQPNSDKVAELRRMINKLGSPNWQERESAETALSDPEIGGPYYNILETAAAEIQKGNDEETKYRLKRILKTLSRPTQQASLGTFDQIVLKDGNQLKGDAGDLEIKCTAHGQTLKLTRKNLHRIGPLKSNTAIAKTNAAPFSVRVFQMPDGEFYTDEQTNVGFDREDVVEQSRIPKNARDMFASDGLILEAEVDPATSNGNPNATAMVMVSTYKFGVDPFPNGRCICVSQIQPRRRPVKFKGAMSISFCLPNQPSVPAAVKEFGLYMKIVDAPRDCLLEAYSAEGHLLCAVETADTRCVFVGVKSNEPIARVRVLSNHYLRDFIQQNPDLFKARLTGRDLEDYVDTDFAVDNICLSQPIEITSPPKGIAKAMHYIRLNNNDVFWTEQYTIDSSGNLKISSPTGTDVSVPLSEVRAIRFNDPSVPSLEEEEDKPKFIQPRWRAMLTDGSILDMTPGDGFTLKQNNKALTRDQVHGIFAGGNPIRVPMAQDFAKGKFVAVFPWCRIASNDFKLNADGFSWAKETKPLFQPVHTLERDETESELVIEEPQPQTNQISYTKTSSPDVPTLWFSPPKPRHPQSGLVRLKDGQQMVLWDSSFELVSMNQKGIVLSFGDSKQEIAWAQVASIEVPIKE